MQIPSSLGICNHMQSIGLQARRVRKCPPGGVPRVPGSSFMPETSQLTSVRCTRNRHRPAPRIQELMDVGSELILCLSCRLPWNNVEHWRKHAPVSIVYLNVAPQKLIRVWPSAAHGPFCEGHELHLRGPERITVIARGWQCLGAVDQKVGDVCGGLPKATAVH